MLSVNYIEIDFDIGFVPTIPKTDSGNSRHLSFSLPTLGVEMNKWETKSGCRAQRLEEVPEKILCDIAA